MRRVPVTVLTVLFLFFFLNTGAAIPVWQSDACPDAADPNGKTCTVDSDGAIIEEGVENTGSYNWTRPMDDADTQVYNAVLGFRARTESGQHATTLRVAARLPGGTVEQQCSRDINSTWETFTCALDDATAETAKYEVYMAAGDGEIPHGERVEVDRVNLTVEYTAYGDLSVATPSIPGTVNKTANFTVENSDVTCSDGFCPNVSTTLLHNTTTGWDLVSTSHGATPFWTGNDQPQPPAGENLCDDLSDSLHSGSCTAAAYTPAWTVNATENGVHRLRVDAEWTQKGVWKNTWNASTLRVHTPGTNDTADEPAEQNVDVTDITVSGDTRHTTVDTAFTTNTTGSMNCTVNTDTSCSFDVAAADTTGSCTVDNATLLPGENTAACTLSTDTQSDTADTGFTVDGTLQYASPAWENTETGAVFSCRAANTGDLDFPGSGTRRYETRLTLERDGETVFDTWNTGDALMAGGSTVTTHTTEELPVGDYRFTCAGFRVMQVGQISDGSDEATVFSTHQLVVDRFDVEEDQVSAGDTITINGAVTATATRPNTSIRILKQGEIQDTLHPSLTREEDVYTFSTPYRVPMKESVLGRVTASLAAATGTDTAAASDTFQVTQPSPNAFRLNITFLPSKPSYQTTEQLDVEVTAHRLTTQNLVDVNTVRCGIKDRSETVLEEESRGVYRGTYTIPRTASGERVFQCQGVNQVVGETVTGRGAASITVNNTLDISLIQPENVRSLERFAGEQVSLTLTVRYANGSTVSQPNITVYANGRPVPATVSREDGEYTAAFAAPDTLESVQVRATDAAGNTVQRNLLDIEQSERSILPFILGMAAITLVLGGATFFTYRKFRAAQTVKTATKRGRVEEELREAENRLEEVKAAKKEAQKRYFKRLIDRETYMNTLHEYEQERDQLTERIERLQNQLDSMPGEYTVDRDGVLQQIAAATELMEKKEEERGTSYPAQRSQLQQLQEEAEDAAPTDEAALTDILERIQDIKQSLRQQDES